MSELDIEKPGGEGAPALRVQTLGGFCVWRDGVEIAPTAWGREKALHLFQFFVTVRGQYLHKEQIIDRLWPDLDLERGDRDFKVALNAVSSVLEPARRPRTELRFVQRRELAYGLNTAETWIDADAFEAAVAAGNRALPGDVAAAIAHYRTAIDLYAGDYLLERRYEDWSSAERERLQVLALGTMTTLADLLVNRSPLESVRLAQRVLATDPAWEAAYRTQMRAYMAQGNRPLALRTYQQCVEALDEEFRVEPLPETHELYEEIQRQNATRSGHASHR
ncbi:MAG: bacterial transcriptional activator domain-containing protein [Chloroflexi bacterium]|nr:bacterial transcriptional activator domain-containing protein [Chloroflexota bacterium]MBU1747511.1 bacterial transcriptional activator domain-containing protein [Chloroflexota bacterium]